MTMQGASTIPVKYATVATIRASLIDFTGRWLGRVRDGGGPCCQLVAQPMARCAARLRRRFAPRPLNSFSSATQAPRQLLYLL